MKETVQGINISRMEYAIKIMDKHHILKEKKKKVCNDGKENITWYITSFYC